MGKSHLKSTLAGHLFSKNFPCIVVLSLGSMKTNVLFFFGLAKVLLLWVKLTYRDLFDP